MASQQFEPMSTGQILDRTFRLYKANFVRFIAIVAVIQIPIGLIMLGATGLLQQEVEAVAQPGLVAVQIEDDAPMPGGARVVPQPQPAREEVKIDPSALIGKLILFVLAVLAMVLAQTLCSAALTKGVSESYLGRDVTVGEAYRFVLPKLGTIILAAILVGLVVMVGLVLLVVPGIIFSLWYALTTQAIVIEDLKATKGMKRSKALASGNLGKMFGLMFVVGIITWLVNALFQGVGGAVAAAMTGPGADAVQAVANLVGQVLATPISAAAMILLYYDLRIRKEGFDLEMLAQSFGSEETPPNADMPAE